MTYDAWISALSPKVDGTWNLYHASQGHKLDFFVMFSSIVGGTANIGQSNYAAANCFLGSFAKYARAKGFPASVIHLGVMEDIGYVSQNPDLLKRCRETSIQLLRENDLLRSLQAAIRQAQSTVESSTNTDMSSVTVGLTPVFSEIQKIAGQGDLRLSLYYRPEMQTEDSKPSELDRMNQFILEVERDPSILALQSSLDLVIEEISRLIQAQPGKDESLESLEAASEVAIDSLMTIEIRSWLRKRLNIDVPTMQITKAKNVRGLAALGIEKLKEKFAFKEKEIEVCFEGND
jgi:acyl carrier protein